MTMDDVIKEAALDYLRSHDGNMYAENRNVAIMAGGLQVDVETVWYSKDEDKIYLHVGCEAFEGDLDIESLSEENQWTMLRVFLQPDPKEPEPWAFDEDCFIEKYCPMEGGNDYLGWIEDIYKLLDGEAEPGDAASTGEYAAMSEDELRKELKRLKGIVLHQAVERYVEQNY